MGSRSPGDRGAPRSDSHPAGSSPTLTVRFYLVFCVGLVPTSLKLVTLTVRFLLCISRLLPHSRLLSGLCLLYTVFPGCQVSERGGSPRQVSWPPGGHGPLPFWEMHQSPSWDLFQGLKFPSSVPLAPQTQQVPNAESSEWVSPAMLPGWVNRPHHTPPIHQPEHPGNGQGSFFPHPLETPLSAA